MWNGMKWQKKNKWHEWVNEEMEKMKWKLKFQQQKRRNGKEDEKMIRDLKYLKWNVMNDWTESNVNEKNKKSLTSTATKHWIFYFLFAFLFSFLCFLKHHFRCSNMHTDDQLEEKRN